jgi:hypothetical protein
MNTIHLEFQNQNARLALRGLPPTETSGKLIRQTPTGVVERVPVITGFKHSVPVNAATLTAGDPEIDLENTGTLLDSETLTGIYVEPGTRKPASDFHLEEVVTDPQGNVKTTRVPNRIANINTHLPVKITKLHPVDQILTRFVFKSTYQIIHQDGLTRNFLLNLARHLETEKKAAILGAGPKGAQPLILRNSSLPVRGFLVGQTHGEDYKILLLITDTELRKPVENPKENPAKSEENNQNVQTKLGITNPKPQPLPQKLTETANIR